MIKQKFVDLACAQAYKAPLTKVLPVQAESIMCQSGTVPDPVIVVDEEEY